MVRASLIGCVILLGVGCAGTRSETPKNEQGLTEAAKQEQTRSPQATASEEEVRCEGTRTTKNPTLYTASFITNDLPGCSKGGLLEGSDERDNLGGRQGDDKIRGLGAKDQLLGGKGSDVIYGGPGNDFLEGDMVHVKNADVIYGGDGDDSISGGEGADVMYGGDGNDSFWEGGAGKDVYPDKFYCGKGKDEYRAGKNDYVSSSCEKKIKPPKPVQ